MSYVRINITDKNRVITGEIHGSECDVLIASLAAEPETIADLETALERFVKFESDWTFFGRMSKSSFDEPSKFGNYLNLEPYDAGVLVIDLAGRIVAVDSSYSAYSKRGTITVADELADDFEKSKFNLPYELSDDWKFVRSVEEYEGSAGRRREERLANPPIDVRAIFYGGPLVKFLVEEMQKAEDLENENLFTDIHRKWLMSEREDLRGKTVREILLEKRDFISFDLHSRSLQWSVTNKCPPDLPVASDAYKFAGFGTNELVVYYDLIRFLLEIHLKRLNSGEFSTVENEVEYLLELKNDWLKVPNPELSGRKPLDIIEAERRRRNLTVSAHECLIDEDCPVCVEMSEIFDTPMFWGLDGCNMDDEFAFSFFKTTEEWDEQQREFEEMSRKFDRRNREDDDDLSIFDEDIIL